MRGPDFAFVYVIKDCSLQSGLFLFATQMDLSVLHKKTKTRYDKI
ncbi:hypothetical protein BACIH_3685 [Bacillus amyloliquefaciens]|nr:hypothetical protein BACIT_2007 [Bacillus amyloliquefaciens]QEY95362.1 hypothetical protein BACIH_3685 [Bacillus amyloliquefaciens]